MVPPSTTRGIVRFGPFEADLSARELWKEGQKVRLQEQPFRILAFLLQQPGKILTREELQQSLWPANTFVEFDHGLNTAIKKIRQALDDSADAPQFIETLPRQGYRFLASVEALPAPEVKPSQTRIPGWFALVFAAIVLGSTSAWFLFRSEPEDRIEPIPVTTYGGAETGPTLSPDGTQVAFTWDGEKQNNFDIYVKRIGSEVAQRLTTDPALDFGAAWSPDGRLIAFLRPLTPDTTGVFLISPAGGQERQVGEVSVEEDFMIGPYLAWSPDSKWIFSVDKMTNDSPFLITLLSVETGQKRRLTNPPKGAGGDFYPALSPDGSKLAFTRFGPGPNNTLNVLSLSPGMRAVGEFKTLYSDDRWIASSSWMPDGREVLFTLGTHYSEDPMLWRIAASGRAAARRLGFAGAGSCCATFSGDGRRLVYSRISCPLNLYRFDLRDKVQTGTSVKLANSTRTTGEPDYSPDGGKIVFTSWRSGAPEIWVCDRDGLNIEKLTSFGARELQYPRWSPDGREIAFSMRRRGSSNSGIFTVRADGSRLSRLTTGPANDAYPAWSRDARWIYFASDRAGDHSSHVPEGRETQVWKIRPGGQELTQVTAHGGSAPQEAPDSEFLYFLKIAGSNWDASSLWRLPQRGGPEIRVLEDAIWALNYAVTREGVYYIPVDFGPVGVSGSKIKFFDFSTGRARHVVSAAHWPMFGLAVSPDGRSLIDCEADMLASDLMMVENFK